MTSMNKPALLVSTALLLGLSAANGAQAAYLSSANLSCPDADLTCTSTQSGSSWSGTVSLSDATKAKIDGALQNVTTDGTLVGNGTAGSPLSIAPAIQQTITDTSNGLAALDKTAVKYNVDANGNPTATVNLTGNPNLPAGTQGVTLTGVAAGAVKAGSKDAVNGSQLYGLANSTAGAIGGGSTVNPDGTITNPTITVGGVTYNNVTAAIEAGNDLAVQYKADANGKPTNTVVLTGDGTGAPVKVTNVAAGAVTATSTDAVNGSQLYKVAMGAVNYDKNPDGSVNYTNVTFNPGGSPTTLHNVAAGTAPTDAANVQQLTNVQNWAQQNINRLAGDIGDLKKETRSGIAVSNALAALTFQPDPGHFAVNGGVGGFKGYSGFAAGGAWRSEDHHWFARAGVGFAPNQTASIGWNAGVGHQFGD